MISKPETGAMTSPSTPQSTTRQSPPARAALDAARLTVPTAVSADLLRPPPRGPSMLMLGLAGLVATFVAWSAWAVVEETTRGDGRVVPASKIQLVQSLEGGIVGEIRVRDGDRVKEGDVILRIDPTLAGSTHGETQERILGLEALIVRLEAELENSAPEFPLELVAAAPRLVAHERQLFESRQQELDAALAAFDQQIRQREQELLELADRIETSRRAERIAREQLEMLEPLAKSRSASRSELLAAEAKLNETRGALTAAELAVPRVEAQKREAADRRAEKLAQARTEALRSLTSARVELNTLTETRRGSADKLARTVLHAPVNGIVKAVHVTTVGQVVKPGSDLVEIVPLDDTLLIEARVRPQDIAFLHPGQRAVVKLTAYDFALYGGLEGTLEHIGADSVTNDKGETYYLIRVRTADSRLRNGGSDLPILPGMVAEVDILTGSKTVLGYLTKPLTRMRHTALRER